MSEPLIERWEDLLDLEDSDYETVVIGKRSVRLASLSAGRMLQWLKDNRDESKAPDNGLVMIAESIVDGNGKRIGKIEDILKLREKSPVTLKKLRDACIKLNRLQVKDEPAPNDSSEPQE
jgi:hypothetical protein